jgi:diamine N-acetyltransferase
VTVAPLRPEERDLAQALAVHPDHARFVATNRASLDEAAHGGHCVPMLVRAGGAPVGFAMHALDPDDGQRWIYRLMIDARFQRRGLGRAALAALLDHLAHEPRVVIGVHPDNHPALGLYRQAGFRPTGETIGGETILARDRQ